MKETDSDLRMQIDALIRDEIQEGINEYLTGEEQSDNSSLGFVGKEDEKELKVNISNREVDKLIKKYKKIKKRQRSSLHEVRKLGLVDKHGNPLK
jgi:VIT1/CCC1 family predicted Fe2+/Mn2+ transporter|tara:strand:+ start:524 stop:808 length:285 start_codon:yes stop_codon:yes gene_type:complete